MKIFPIYAINLRLKKISKIYVNRGPGSFAGIRNSLSTVKAFYLVNKIDYYCFSFDDFDEKNLSLKRISEIYVNRGPGSFAGIRNSLAVVKAIYVAKKIDYYCFSFDDFDKLDNKKYENIPNLCDKMNIKKNLINPIYLS